LGALQEYAYGCFVHVPPVPVDGFVYVPGPPARYLARKSPMYVDPVPLGLVTLSSNPNAEASIPDAGIVPSDVY